MPRKPRLEYAGAVYHVMDRGDRSEDIFHDHKDRQRFLATLGQACGRTGWRVHCFVLMRNHYHLLLETPEPNLSRGMHWLQTTYTVRHNKRHQVKLGVRPCSVLFGLRAWQKLRDYPRSPPHFSARTPAKRGQALLCAFGLASLNRIKPNIHLCLASLVWNTQARSTM